MSDVAHLTRVFARYKPRLLQMVPQMFELLFKKEMPVWWHAPWLHFLCALPVVGATLKEYLRKRLDRLFGEKFAAINIGGALFNPAIKKFLELKSPSERRIFLEEERDNLSVRDIARIATTLEIEDSGEPEDQLRNAFAALRLQERYEKERGNRHV